jgi:hypothetical protein
VKRSLTFVLCGALALAACGYFNAMYNAERRFADAERAVARGQSEDARRAWLDAIDGAAASYRKHPTGRWADDALLLIARARFNLGEHQAAGAAAMAALGLASDPALRAQARTLIGAAEYSLGRFASARAVLDTVVGDASVEVPPAARLWRARARFAAGDAAAWEDLDAAAAAGGSTADEASIEAAARALVEQDGVRFAQAVQRLIASPGGARFSDSVLVLLDRGMPADGDWPDPVAGADGSPWPSARLEPLELVRARRFARSGDTTAAIEAALHLAARASAASAASARFLAARLDLARAGAVEDLARARAVLLPALANDSARATLRTLRVVEVLLDRAGQGQPLALFAAAEMARDELGATAFARALFVAYADLVPDAVWAPKALLAAAALAPAAGDDVPQRFAGHADNVYVRAVLHDDATDAFADAEDRLARGLAALRLDAFREADQRDIRVGSAVARLDSLKARVRADSLRLACGTLLDSLAIAGIRADSVRSACLRGDSARVGLVLRMDTLLLRDTTGRDTMRARIRRVVRDTFPAGFR